MKCANGMCATVLVYTAHVFIYYHLNEFRFGIYAILMRKKPKNDCVNVLKHNQ